MLLKVQRSLTTPTTISPASTQNPLRHETRVEKMPGMPYERQAANLDPDLIMDIDYEDCFEIYQPTYFFLYGSLMDPARLRRVLKLSQNPKFVAANIVGWKIKLWGQYPALITKVNNVIHGMAYMVETSEQVAMLERYETDMYMLRVTSIQLSDGREVSGKMFVWNANESLLKERLFDLRDWQMSQLD